MSSIVIIGSGLAGYNVIKELRRLNSERAVTLVCADDGAFYSKPMLSTALSKGQSADQLALFDGATMVEKENFKLMANTSVTAIDTVAKRIETSSGPVAYEQLVLALGSSPIPLKINNFSPFSVNNLDDYRHFRENLENKHRVSIIGGGLVGCEFAHDLAASGFTVDVIALSNYPLNLLVPEDVGHYIEKQLQPLKISWHWQNAIENVESIGDGLTATLSDGNQIHSDIILSAIGLHANTKLAKDAGLVVNKGIVVDSSLKTSDPYIFALGDCAEIAGRNLQYVLPLMASARNLASTLSGNPLPLKLPAMPITVKLPQCPTTLYPAPEGVAVKWEIESDDNGLTALAYHNDKLAGFVLCGKNCSQRAELQRQLPAILP